jgi:hypothetical protein
MSATVIYTAYCSRKILIFHLSRPTVRQFHGQSGMFKFPAAITYLERVLSTCWVARFGVGVVNLSGGLIAFHPWREHLV